MYVDEFTSHFVHADSSLVCSCMAVPLTRLYNCTSAQERDMKILITFTPSWLIFYLIRIVA